METDMEKIIARFRDSAGRIFVLIWEDFERRAKILDRQRDENVFQQLQSRYIDELRKQLTKIVEASLNEYSGDRNMLRRDLTNQVSYNVSEFLQKIRSM